MATAASAGRHRQAPAGTGTPAGLPGPAGQTWPQEADAHPGGAYKPLWPGEAMTAIERSVYDKQISSCDATVLAEQIASFGLDTKPTAGTFP